MLELYSGWYFDYRIQEPRMDLDERIDLEILLSLHLKSLKLIGQLEINLLMKMEQYFQIQKYMLLK